MRLESPETRRLSDKEVIIGLTSHLDFFLFAADDPKAFGTWVEKNPQYSLSINLLNRLIAQHLKTPENFSEFLEAIHDGGTNITRYLVSDTKLLNILKEFLAPVIIAADKWEQDIFNQSPMQAQEREDLTEMRMKGQAKSQNRALALVNILKLRELFPKNGDVNFNQFTHLFFSGSLPSASRLQEGVRVLYDLIHNHLDKPLLEFKLIAKAKLMLDNSYARLGSAMTIDEEEFDRRHELLLALKEILDGEVGIEYTITITITDSLNDLNDYIHVDQNYSRLQNRIYPEINALKLLSQLLQEGEFRKILGEERAITIEKRLLDIVLNEDSPENIVKIMHAYREISHVFQIDQYSKIQEVLRMQSFLSFTPQDEELESDDKAVLRHYELLDDDFIIRNLDDLMRVHQLYHVLSNTETMKEMMKYQSELEALEKTIRTDDQHQLNTPLLGEIIYYLDISNEYKSSFLEAEECYFNISGRIDEDINNKNDEIYRKLLSLSEQFPNGLKLEDFKFSEIPQDEIAQSIEKINYYMVLMRSHLFDQNDYKALFSVKTSHQSLLEKLTTPQASQLAYLIERVDVDDKQKNLLGLVEEAYRKPMKSHFDFVFRNMADKNVEEYIKGLQDLGKGAEVESFCRKIEKIVPDYFKSDKLYDTDISVKDVEKQRMPIQSYTTTPNPSIGSQEGNANDQKDITERTEVKKYNL